MVRERSRSRLGHAVGAFTSNARNANLRRAHLSFLGSRTAEWAFTVALGIVAYRDGGATAVGLVGLFRMVPAALLAPFLIPLADRGPREHTLVVVSVLRGVATAVIALVAVVNGPVMLIYVIAVLSTVSSTLYRPAHSALLPSLCHTGHQLASANVVRGLLDSVATLVGPLLATVLLSLAGADVVFVFVSVTSFVTAALVFRLRYEAPPRPAAPGRARLFGEAVEGIGVSIRNRGLAVVLGLAAAQALTRGALTVLSVVVAIELLETGEPGVGALMAAVGVGAVCGSLTASIVVDTKRLGALFALGIATWGLPLVLIGVFPDPVLALVFIAFIGLGNALVDASGFTLIGRLAPDAVLARVFGVLEGIVTLSLGLGSIVASVLVGWLDVRPALVVIGLLCPILALLSVRRLRRLDRDVGALDADVTLLREVPMLAPLPLPAVEALARGLRSVSLGEGTVVFHQGDIGDAYYVIESGQVDVIGDGHELTSLGPGEGFGEIALLRRSPRTATVVARSNVSLKALGARCFLPVVLGYTPSSQQAEADVDELLHRFEPGSDQT